MDVCIFLFVAGEGEQWRGQACARVRDHLSDSHTSIKAQVILFQCCTVYFFILLNELDLEIKVENRPTAGLYVKPHFIHS